MMSYLVILFLHFVVTLARFLRPGGVRSVVAESALLKHQLLILNRSRQRSPNLRSSDRVVAGLCALLIFPHPSDPFSNRSENLDSFGIQAGTVDGLALCRMLHRAIRKQSVPKYLSSDHDPLFQFHQWKAILRILEVTEFKTVPYVPLSHPFVERVMDTIRQGLLDRTLFWTTSNLEAKLLDFRHYCNGHRSHAGLDGHTPEPGIDGHRSSVSFRSYQWQKHCRGSYQTPIAA